MYCATCGGRDECREICPELESHLATLTRSGREVLIDPSLIARVAHRSDRTLADLSPDRPWIWDYVHSGLSALPTSELRPFLLHFYDGKSVAQVARELRVHRSTAHRHITRALARLKKEIARKGIRFPGDADREAPG